MVTKNKSKKPASKKAKAPTKKAAVKEQATTAKTAAVAQKASIEPHEESTLLALAGEFEAPIDAPVEDVLQEAREVEAVLREHGEALYGKSDLDPVLGDSIGARRQLLDSCEGVWFSARISLTPEAKRALQREAELLKRDSVAALRFFLRRNQEVQSKVSAIQEGSGLADLLDDLNRLSTLLIENEASLEKADLPNQATAREAATRAVALSDALGTSVATTKTNKDSAKKIALRNRAFWYLREAMDEVRAAGRYVFRNQPKLLPLFHATRSGHRTKEPAKPTPSQPKA